MSEAALLARLLAAPRSPLPRAELAAADGVLARLRAAGWPLEEGAEGVTLAAEFDPLVATEIAARLAGSGLAVEVHPLLDSTQEEAARRLAAGWREPLLILAEWQEAGRGRRGRRWLARPGQALLASLLVPAPRPPGALGGLSPALGLGLAEALAAAGFPGVGLKWPNDLMLGERKLGGVLVELIAAAGESGWIAVGFGLNLATPEASELAGRAAGLAELGPLPRRSALAAALARAALAALRRFAEGGFAPFREGFAARHLLQGREVRLEAGGGWRSGRVAGIAEDGALILATGSGTLRVLAGEVEAL
ncbi:MAG: biotin--[acetyl-CoA-carboxylase] ligase [Xanthomonadales bacterium]|nr:biotin--[acetyl-CoA-carboxylase] ligase [Xanthomonadales bacterium]